MKKKLLLGALLLTATSAMADPIDLQKAQVIASDYLSENTAEPMLVKRAERDMTKARHLPAKTAQSAPYYIFSRGAGQGFVIVSGDDCLPDVLGYTESGDFIEDQMPPQLLSWLEMWANAIEETQLRGENVSRKSEARKANYTTGGIRKAAADRVDVPVLLTSQWYQTWPYNCHCPYVKNTTSQAVTGCVATAAAQVLYYFRRDLPDLLGATTPTYDWCEAPVTESVPKGTPMKWGLMLDSYPGNLPQEYYDAIGYFHLAVGAYSAMGYGYSSGAYISALVDTYRDCFNVDSKNIWAGHDRCQELAYADLIKKRPVVYAGYDKDNGGHAIVIDGYRSRDDKYHFNFGWGGNGPESGGNGWYIMEDEGVNGYGHNPSITYDIHPKSINAKATISAPQGFYASHENKVRVSVKNKSTFPLEGVYLFMATTNVAPTDLSDAKSSETVVIPNDGTPVDVYLTAKPAQTKNYYITITDENLNVLGRERMEASSLNHSLGFRGLEVLSGTEKETHGGHDYTVIYGSYVTCYADVFNEGEVSYQETARLQISVSEDDGETFTVLGNKNSSKTNIAPLSAGELHFSFTTMKSLPIEPGKLYSAKLATPIASGSNTQVNYESGDTEVYFLLRESEGMTATLDDNGTTLKFSGKWNAHDFESLTGARANASATLYDLTDVEGIGRVPVLSGKEHCLILVKPGVDVTGVNVISANGETAVADHLSLAVGYDFAVSCPIQASSVSLALNATPNQWTLLTVPCNFTVPSGIFAKRLNSHTTSGITNKTTNVSELEAGHTYLLMTSSSRKQVLTAATETGVLVSPVPAENADPAMIGTFVNMKAPAGAFYLDNDYFRPANEDFDVPAFGGYFAPSDITSSFRSSSTQLIDNAYISLGEAISEVYDVYDQYAEYVTADARQSLLEAISSAESIFTTRELERTEAVQLSKDLRALAEQFPRQIDGQSLKKDVDVTFLIVNPSFERGLTASSTNGSTYGWTKGKGVSVKNNDDYNYRAVGADGNHFVFSETGTSASGASISQTILNVPKGVYAMTAMVGTDTVSTSAVTIFANEMTQTVPASVSGQYYLREARIDNIIVREGDDLTIGVRDCTSWYKADDFHLYYVRALTEEEDVPTGIEEYNGERLMVKDGIYDLTGRRLSPVTSDLSTLRKGIYIINGKKTLIK